MQLVRPVPGAVPRNPLLERNLKEAGEKPAAPLPSRRKLPGGVDREVREGASAASVGGPSDWRSVIRKHREALNISADPPGNETDIT